jgi:hypothetical protein
MITLKCSTEDSMLITAMTPFQGDLKKRTPQDIADLADSLVTEGLLMPFVLWQDGDDSFKILDGHGRYEAIIRIALRDSSVLTQVFPCILVKVADETEAKQALLQIISTYGKVTRKGIVHFASTVPNYKAPVIKSVAAKPVKMKPPESDLVIVRVRVPRDKVTQLTQLLKQVSGLEVY